jgi:uncharacterized membrane protein
MNNVRNIFTLLSDKKVVYYSILFSLILLSFKVFFDLIIAFTFFDVVDGMAITLNFLLVLTTLGQIFGMLKKSKYTWIFSAMQVVLIFYMAQGSFSWLFSYILKPLTTFQMAHIYILTLFLYATEIVKTVWLYRHR